MLRRHCPAGRHRPAGPGGIWGKWVISPAIMGKSTIAASWTRHGDGRRDRAGHPATGYANSLNVGHFVGLLPHSWGSVTPASHENPAVGSACGRRSGSVSAAYFPVGAPLRDESNGVSGAAAHPAMVQRLTIPGRRIPRPAIGPGRHRRTVFCSGVSVAYRPARRLRDGVHSRRRAVSSCWHEKPGGPGRSSRRRAGSRAASACAAPALFTLSA